MTRESLEAGVNASQSALYSETSADCATLEESSNASQSAWYSETGGKVGTERVMTL